MIAAFTGADLADLPVIAPPMPGMINAQMSQPLLARDVVRYVGEPVAVVVTEGRYQGEDAADLVDVDYDALPAGGRHGRGRRGRARRAVPGGGHQRGRHVRRRRGAGGRPVRRLRGGRLPHDRQPAGRARADGDPGRGRGLGRGRQADGVDPEPGRAGHARRPWPACSASTRPTLRVITPDVGGAFGAKFGADPEHAVVCWVARRLGRPARWAETRNENLVGDDARPGAAPDGHHRRQPGRHRGGLPAGDPAGRRGLPEDRRVPAGPDHLDGARPVRDPARRGGGDGRW